MNIYVFKNKELWKQCFVHKSKHGTRNYETLEWMGDSVLKLTISMFLVDQLKGASIKELNETRAKLETNDCLCQMCKRLNWSSNIQLGTNQKLNAKMQADVVEAVLCAVFMDSNYNMKVVVGVYTIMYYLVYPHKLIS